MWEDDSSDSQRVVGTGECIPFLSAEHHIARWHSASNDGRIYQKDVKQRPLDAGEEVSVFQAAFHRPAKRYPVSRGESA